MKQTIIAFLFLIVLTGKLVGQTKTINLWNGKIPGAIQQTKYKQTVDSLNSWMRFVTEPTLDVYPAPVEKANGTAVVICPGGGYGGLAIGHEGVAVAKWLNDLGITAFVLKYRLPSDAIMVDKSVGPLQDAQKAIRFVRQHAKDWQIQADKIGVMGFSAGGHLASTLSTHFNEKSYESTDVISARPDFALLIYPVISMEKGTTHMGSRVNLLGENPSADRIKYFSNELQVSAETPPTFLIHSIDDGAVPVQNSIRYATALSGFRVPCELHIYQSGGHGYGLASQSRNTESSWSEACSKWLETQNLLLRKKEQ